MTNPGHESLHLDLFDPKVNWMENLCFCGYDEQSEAGFLLHMKNRPNQNIVEFRFAARAGDATCTWGSVQPLTGGFHYAGFEADVVESWHHWRLRVSGVGKSIADAGDVIGLPVVNNNDLPFAIDINWTSPIDALDWALINDTKETDSAGSHHYDQGGHIAGSIRIGDRTLQVKGFGYRDHSWGPRNFKQMDVARYIGFVTEDMRTYFDGLFVDYGKQEGVAGFSYTIQQGIGVAGPRPDVAVIEGEDRERAYRKVSITVPGATYIATTIWNIVLPLVPERYLSNVALVRVETPDGRAGFGMVERGRLFQDNELERMLERAEGKPR